VSSPSTARDSVLKRFTDDELHLQSQFGGHPRIEGKRARGRQRGTLLEWLERATGVRPLDLIKMMRERREEEAVTAAYDRVLARHTD